LRRDPQNLRGVIYDTSLGPADPQVVRYRLPPQAFALKTPLRVQAALRYRKFSADYAAFACAMVPAGPVRERCQDLPTLTVAEDERMIYGDGSRVLGFSATRPQSRGPFPLWSRALDHGLGLSDGLVERAGAAEASLQRAVALAPQQAEPLIGLARLYLTQGRTDEVLATCQAAHKLRPDHPACWLLPTLALYRTYRFAQARPYVERAALDLPNDRLVLSLLSRIRGLMGETHAALQAAEQVLAIDEESEEGHYQRALLLRELGRPKEAAEAEARYLFYRRPIERDQALRTLFRIKDPKRADEDSPAHIHDLQ
jgi:tetratricopeptide (TPR) repeat protein